MKNELIENFHLIEGKFKGNFTNLFGNLYLVRTQAGLKNAIIDYAGDIDITDKTFNKVLQYLRFDEDPDLSKFKYPLLIEFIPFYMGYHGTTTCVKFLNK